MMRQSLSPIEEKQALLARMHATREGYQRMLIQFDAPETPLHVQRKVDEFPRSKTMRLVIQHPYLCLFSVVALVALKPQRIFKTRAVQTVVNRGAAVTSKAIRYQSKIVAAARLFGIVNDFLKRRRHKL
jgi:hypothetical protein